MNAQRVISGCVVLAASVWLAGCASQSMPPPAGTTSPPSAGAPSGATSNSGSASSSGAGQSGASQTGSAQTGAAPAGSVSSAGAGDDPGTVFDKSLGDFDGEIGREREEMAKTGQGSGRAAETRESSDTGSVRSAGRGGAAAGPDVSVSGAGTVGGLPGGIGGIGSVGGIGDPGAAGGNTGSSQTKGAGSSQEPGAGPGEGSGSGADSGVGPEGGPAAGSGSGASGGAAAELPADIPVNGAGEDQVARQLREAAMAEKDPAIRDALWNEYRKVMGIKKK